MRTQYIRKLTTTVITVMLSLSICAQTGQWLKHIPSDDSIEKDDKVVSFMFSNGDGQGIALICPKGKSTIESANLLYLMSDSGLFLVNGLYREDVSFGIYNKQGCLVDIITTRSKGDNLGDLLKVRMTPALRKYFIGAGWKIRIKARKYMDADFDMVVPSFYLADAI